MIYRLSSAHKQTRVGNCAGIMATAPLSMPPIVVADEAIFVSRVYCGGCNGRIPYKHTTRAFRRKRGRPELKPKPKAKSGEVPRLRGDVLGRFHVDRAAEFGQFGVGGLLFG